MVATTAIEYTLRDERAEDEPFAVELYRVLRRDPAFVQCPVDKQRSFIRFERDVQQQTIEAICPTAKASIVLIDGVPAGELIVDRTDAGIRLIEIALLPSFQRQGIGSDLVRTLCDEAALRGVPVSLRVAVGNTAARAFYATHGFVQTDEDSMYIDLEWRR